MGRKHRQQKSPPLPNWSYKERGKQDCVGGPESCRRRLGGREEETDLRPGVIADCDKQHNYWVRKEPVTAKALSLRPPSFPWFVATPSPHRWEKWCALHPISRPLPDSCRSHGTVIRP